ncbi:MAG: L-aspartate oxidase [Acidimicrobiia bacterium]|nr:L-aspartate oxidase [Acidimicrobiia bacterium]
MDLLVLGSGIAGLSAAIHAAQRGWTVGVVTKGELATSATRYAQGGVAAALGAPDSTELHETDTLIAGAGLCDTDAVRVLVTEGPRRVRELMALGAKFDERDGELQLAIEGGHSLPRVVHAGGDATGAEIERALADAAHALPNIDVRERCFSVDLIVEAGRCVGIHALDSTGRATEIRARNTVLATGGAGQLFSVTTNPAVSTGDGIGMALRAGVAVADVEFMQFHPTALDNPSMPRPLLSEALRGDGAVLRDEQGVQFMLGEHPLADLAPRDIVARAIARRLVERRLPHLWLDATAIADFPTRFPTIWASAQAVGLDPRTDLLPVAPAAHYLSGGIATDLDGASTLPGLWSCGEAACSGVHGANRLASNSLLDGLVFAPRIIEAIAEGKDAPEPSGVLRGIDPGVLDVPELPVQPEGAMGLADLQQIMTAGAGVLRDVKSLETVARAVAIDVGAHDVGSFEVRNLLTVARALAAAALAREESRGTHTRLDFPETLPEFSGRFFGCAGPPVFVPLPAEVPA